MRKNEFFDSMQKLNEDLNKELNEELNEELKLSLQNDVTL